MKILSIETSCDETAVSIVEVVGDLPPRFHVLANLVNSQIDIHKEYGGVFPAMAKREHAKNLPIMVEQALKEANMLVPKTRTTLQKFFRTVQRSDNAVRILLNREPEAAEFFVDFFARSERPQIDAIAVTVGPGLEPALWVGVNIARLLATEWNIPLVPANHMEGHIYSVFANKDTFEIAEPRFPILALLISGGHTELVLVKSFGEYEKIGQTRDDAVGEAFDKVGRLLGLEYPGGPKISRLASKFRGENTISLPRPMIDSGNLDFSFSGLKTASRNLIQKQDEITDDFKIKFAHAFESAVIDVLVAKTTAAIEEYAPKGLVIAGGVAASQTITDALRNATSQYDEFEVYAPDLAFTGDNSLMIAIAGYFGWLQNEKGANIKDVRAQGNLSL